MGALVLAALNDLAGALVEAFPPPTVVADGSWQGNDPPDANGYTRSELRRKLRLDEPRPGLVPCSTCKTPQRPGAVHFASNTAIRPCAGSWRRR